jgi:hypothetical protein
VEDKSRNIGNNILGGGGIGSNSNNNNNRLGSDFIYAPV